MLKGTEGGAHREVAEKLCELARAIRFTLGPPRSAPVNLVITIADLFRAAADTIQPAGDPQVETFKSNIRERSSILRRSLNAEHDV